MKGTDVTAEQLQHAREFLEQVQLGKAGFNENIIMAVLRVGDLIRLLAWYGAIRAKSGSESPRALVTINPPPTLFDLQLSARSYHCLSNRWGDPGLDDGSSVRAVLGMSHVHRRKNFGIISFLEVVKALEEVGISRIDIAES